MEKMKIMFNIIKIILGGSIFFLGVSAEEPRLYSLLLVMVGGYIISRPFSFDSGFGNMPLLFILGVIFLIPSFFIIDSVLEPFIIEDDKIDTIRLTMVLVSSVVASLSICKK